MASGRVPRTIVTWGCSVITVSAVTGSYGSYSRRTCQRSHRDDPESTPLNRRGPAGLPPSFPPRPRASSQPAVAPPAGPPTSTPHGAPNLEAIVKIAHEEGHSDVHLGVGEVPRYRARGEMQSTEWPATDLSTFRGGCTRSCPRSRSIPSSAKRSSTAPMRSPSCASGSTCSIPCGARRWCYG